ncbi:DNA glycosylase AlkZ-like family protein [Streptomyces adustus]|uniref:DNA glycosylase AlkZ-like family protein n=1 Tax=Streptomyces adustus TaxID=1609272 RepID=UPI0035DA3AB0
MSVPTEHVEQIRDRPGTLDVRMLPAYDNYLVGYRGRESSVPAAHHGRVRPGGGVIRPTVVVDGPTVGTWARRDGGRVVQVDAFGPLPSQVQALVDAESSAGTRFLHPAT